MQGVRFNNRSAQPLGLDNDQVTAFYAAYARWAALLARPERQLDLRLAPGDCLVFGTCAARPGTGTGRRARAGSASGSARR